MEWLLAHSDDTEVAPECVSADSTNATDPSLGGAEAAAGGGDSGGASSSSGTIETTPEVKSFKCEDW